MILEFSISNTLSIAEKETLSFEAVCSKNDTDSIHYAKIDEKKILKQLCLYGANASGKTKMLEALHFYINFMRTSFTRLEPDEPTHFIPFKFASKNNKTGEFELIFYIKDNKKYIRYEYNLKLTEKEVESESLYYAPKKQKKLIFQRQKNKHTKWGTDIPGEKKILEAIARPNCSFVSAGAQVQHPVIKQFYDNIAKRYKGLIKPSMNLSGHVFYRMDHESRFKNKLIELLAASDMGNIKGININTEIITDDIIKHLPIKPQSNKPKVKRVELLHHYNDTEYSLPISQESSGTLKMMGLTAPLNDLTETPSILLLDELETSLHQELLEIFLQIFLEASENSQLIFTTHNQELLDSGLLRDDEVWFCYKTPQGNSKYNSITDYKDISPNISRKKLYRADKFGALPNININQLKDLFCGEKNS